MLKAVLDNLDGLDAKYHDLYDERDGKFHMKPIEGFKPEIEVTRVTTALGKERDDHKQTKQKLNAFAGMDPIEVQKKLDLIPELEIKAAGAVDEKKLAELADSRAQRLLAPVQRELETTKTQLGEAKLEVGMFKAQEVTRKVVDTIRTAATAAKVSPEAIEDAIAIGERLFEVDEAGTVVTKDKVGVAPGLKPDQWLADLLPRKPHWTATSSGGGARNGGNGGPAGVNPWSKDGWNMTAQGKIVTADLAKAERLAKQAGTTVGGRKPA